MDVSGQNSSHALRNTALAQPSGYAVHKTAMEPTESDGKIRNAISQAEQILSEIHNAINDLESRLDTVLTPSSPSNAGTGAAGAQAICSHVKGRMDIVNEGSIYAIHRLRTLMGRVEI